MRQQIGFAATFIAAALTSTAQAVDYSSSPTGPTTTTTTYDNSTPTSGGTYSTDNYSAASPTEPTAQDLGQAVASYDLGGELFGESRYQLQVAQTANMLIAIEALRGSVGTLQSRISTALNYCQSNEALIADYLDECYFAQS